MNLKGYTPRQQYLRQDFVGLGLGCQCVLQDLADIGRNRGRLGRTEVLKLFRDSLEYLSGPENYSRETPKNEMVCQSQGAYLILVEDVFKAGRKERTRELSDNLSFLLSQETSLRRRAEISNKLLKFFSELARKCILYTLNPPADIPSGVCKLAKRLAAEDKRKSKKSKRIKSAE